MSLSPLIFSSFFEALKVSPITETSTCDWKISQINAPIAGISAFSKIQYQIKAPVGTTVIAGVLTNFLLWNR